MKSLGGLMVVSIAGLLVACQAGGTPSPTPALPLQAPTATPTGMSTPTPPPPLRPLAVVLVPPIDQLPVRAGPGPDQPILADLPPDATGLLHTGREQTVQGARWMEVRLPDGRIGWVNAAFLSEEVSPQAFCVDPQAQALIDRLEAAIRARDGQAL
ncbi:MAG: hypothetical protein J7452_03785, partial [Thermoflexus sp.]|nr:hypothetical protein [Thermoflexus sp.]